MYTYILVLNNLNTMLAHPVLEKHPMVNVMCAKGKMRVFFVLCRICFFFLCRFFLSSFSIMQYDVTRGAEEAKR